MLFIRKIQFFTFKAIRRNTSRWFFLTTDFVDKDGGCFTFPFLTDEHSDKIIRQQRNASPNIQLYLL